MSILTFQRVRDVDIPAGRTRSITFFVPFVHDRAVRITNRGPGILRITRSVSLFGFLFRRLPGRITLAPGRTVTVFLPRFAIFAVLNLTAIGLRVRARLVWRTSLIG